MTNEQADVVVRKMFFKGRLTQEECEALEVLLDANRYRISVKPSKIEKIPFHNGKLGICPECGNYANSSQEACDWCGQKLKWEDEE